MAVARTTPFVLALGGIAAAFAALYVQERLSAAREHEATLAEMRAMLASAEQEHSTRVVHEIVTVPAAQPVATASAERPGTAPSPVPPAHPTRFDGMDPKTMPAEFDATFRSESVDATWSRSTGRALHDYFDRMAVGGATVAGIECRSETCLVSARFAGASDREAFLRQAFTPGPESLYAKVNLGVYAPAPEADGNGLSARIYLLRASP